MKFGLDYIGMFDVLAERMLYRNEHKNVDKHHSGLWGIDGGG